MENDTINIREYFPLDKEAVLELMRLNTPLYFASEEEADLSEYLDNEREYYYVLLSGVEIIGCGGINIADNGTRGKISWDIIHPDWQGHSLGSLLLKCIFKNIKQIQWNGRPVRTPSDFMLVADRIEEKTGEHISDSTIKRLWIPRLIAKLSAAKANCQSPKSWMEKQASVLLLSN